jgi:hypothetical protein
MGFFGPDVGKINRERENAVNAATGNYASGMSQYMDSGRGANVQNQQGTSAANFGGADVIGDVSQYLDPSLQHQMQQATGQLQNAYGSRGSLFSGAAGNAIGENARSMAEKGWGDAFSRATNARQQQFTNQMGMDQFNNQAGQTNFQNQFGVNQANFGNQNEVQGTVLGNKVANANAAAQASMSEKSGWDYLMDAGKLAGGVAATAFGGPAGGALYGTAMGGLK